MKIAYIIPSLAQKGPIIVVHDIVCSLLKIKDVSCIDIYYFDDIHDIKFPCRTTKISLKDKIDFDKYDIIHSHMLRPDFYVFLNKLKGNIKIAKTITTIHQFNYQNLKHDFNNSLKAYITSKLWELILIKKDLIITLTKEMQNFYKNLLPLRNKKIIYIYNGRTFNHSHSTRPPQSNNKKINIGTSCLLTKRKGIDQVLRVLPYIENVQYHIAGNGQEMENLKNLAAELGITEKVIFHGFLNDINSFLSNLDIFIFPSKSEGFSLSLLEAAAYKLPIIASDIPNFREIFTENEISFFKLDDKYSLINAIDICMKNMPHFSAASYKKYKLCYTAEKMSLNYYKEYKKLLKS